MDAFCRSESLGAGEPIAGSAATETSVWLALEHVRPWGTKAITDSGLPVAVSERLVQLEREVVGARAQLVRGEAAAGPTTFLVSVSDLECQRAVRFVLPSVQDMLDVDVPAIVDALRAGGTVANAAAIDRPLVLVCTNGRRDRCCAKWGLPLYRALARRDDIECWQTTHIGGHRFAPTLVSLPDGLCYGRLQIEDLDGLVASVTRGAVYEPARTLRGRTCLTAPAQVAEIHWRQRTGETRITALRASAERLQGEAHVVSLTDDRGAGHTIAVEHRLGGERARPSCGKEPASVRNWYVHP